MKKVAKFGIAALLLVSVVASAFAFSGRGFGNEAAKKALEAGNYNAYVEAIEEGFQRRKGELTEEKFNEMVERFQNRAGNKEKIQENREKLQQAMGNGYDAWLEAVNSIDPTPKIAEYINSEEDFNKLVEMRDLRENARQIAEELGLERHKGFGKGCFGRREPIE